MEHHKDHTYTTPNENEAEFLDEKQDIQESPTFKSACKNIISKASQGIYDFLSTKNNLSEVCPDQKRHIGESMAHVATESIKHNNF
ncbi:hypothetical protein GX865_00450 [Candidatus Saccharibacteria bacterium]|jgi:hypothetical protein|nr:hypothetical protein [Candidatus Saccharibacteria bacterium]